MEFHLTKVPLNGNCCKTLQDTEIRCMGFMSNIGQPNHNPNSQIWDNLIRNWGWNLYINGNRSMSKSWTIKSIFMSIILDPLPNIVPHFRALQEIQQKDIVKSLDFKRSIWGLHWHIQLLFILHFMVKKLLAYEI